MKKGILIYAHNNESVDYALLSIISAGLAKKNLQVPVSLITDNKTVLWMKKSKIYHRAEIIFENIIDNSIEYEGNKRILHDGFDNKTVPFINSDRFSAWDLTPYDRTLLIDSDFLILSSHLAEYWNADYDVMLGKEIKDFCDNRLGYYDRYISDTGVKLYWATTVMFTKNNYSKLFFDLVKYIKENYLKVSEIFRFNPAQFRNDIAFSIAKHILSGFEEIKSGDLPSVITTIDRDILFDVKDRKLSFLLTPKMDQNYCAATVKDIDVHVMNKQSIVRNKDKFFEII